MSTDDLNGFALGVWLAITVYAAVGWIARWYYRRKAR
jgi:hypothetical protein